MLRIVDLQQIERLLPELDLLCMIEQGFIAYSQGRAIVPPVGELLLDNGEVHIKSGYIQDDEFYVIKVASGFYANPELGLPSSNGLMQLFDQQTGQLRAILLDEGRLTDIRTAVAGAICARYLSVQDISLVGIIGTGTQARLQLQYLQRVRSCRRALVWGRSGQGMEKYQYDMEKLGFEVELADSPQQVCEQTRLIVTTTPSTTPILKRQWIQAGTHITCVGSDTPQKQELNTDVLSLADLVVVDSITQCIQRGEVSHALRSHDLSGIDLLELGNVIDRGKGRSDPSQITVADLTGVAVQDIKIAQAVYRAVETQI